MQNHYSRFLPQDKAPLAAKILIRFGKRREIGPSGWHDKKPSPLTGHPPNVRKWRDAASSLTSPNTGVVDRRLRRLPKGRPRLITKSLTPPEVAHSRSSRIRRERVRGFTLIAVPSAIPPAIVPIVYNTSNLLVGSIGERLAPLNIQGGPLIERPITGLGLEDEFSLLRFQKRIERCQVWPNMRPCLTGCFGGRDLRARRWLC